ncbi:hypothetical protein PILCRDRAFT_328667 [Piloderma croceum F 1598]|uniref:Cyanovirin-N domain-containing protein n=1 Tax=Piloderma croceum (strain F 1598) TaxID=765440 RepID=A0A0C3BHV9_PILCF|nr:hypothetical protein PILCRDRAFT_328667 [Piloderma croceum F 1598]
MGRVAFFIAFMFVLVLFPTIVDAAVARASGTPACATCPEADTGGYGNGEHSDSNGVLFCEYPSFGLEKPRPNTWNCTYNDMTGALIHDGDFGLCHDTAVITGCSKRKRNIVEVLKRRAEVRATLSQSSQPEYMPAKRALGMKGRAN